MKKFEEPLTGNDEIKNMSVSDLIEKYGIPTYKSSFKTTEEVYYDNWRKNIIAQQQRYEVVIIETDMNKHNLPVEISKVISKRLRLNIEEQRASNDSKIQRKNSMMS